ncbi:MAG: sensor histidine kinase [Chloroflexota bacterium]
MQTIAFVLIYFVYGLGFFSLGLALFLEANRYTALGESQNLRYLALFGITHGVHEWLDMLMILASFFSIGLHQSFLWIRIVLLASSFFFLIVFGSRVLITNQRKFNFRVYSPIGLVILYLIAILVTEAATPQQIAGDWFRLTDFLARYILAVPGALLAAFAFRYQSQQQTGTDGLIQLRLKRVGLWFGIYAVSQLTGPAAKMYSLIASDQIADMIHLMIPATRSTIAILIAIDVVKAIQYSEQNRQKREIQVQREKVDALQQASEALQLRNDLRKKLMFQMVRIQEEERARISRELHDETAQMITALSANLAAVQHKIPKEHQPNKLLNQITNLINDLSLNIHRLVHELRPAQLDELGLVPAIEFLVERSQNNLGLKLNSAVTIKTKRFDPMVEAVVYRAAQESLNNIYKHAKTTNAKLALSESNEKITLLISDNGVGFNQETVDFHQGFGLAGMKERVEMVSGKIKVTSVLGEGTTIEINIPINKNNEGSRYHGSDSIDAG